MDSSEKVSGPAEKVSDTAEKVSDTAEKVSDPAEKVSGPIEKVSDTAEKVSSPAEKVSSPAEKVSGPAEKVPDTAEKVSGPAENVSYHAEKSGSGTIAVGTVSKTLTPAVSKPSILTAPSGKSSATKISRRISIRSSKRRVDVEKATAAWGMDADRTLGAKLSIRHLAELNEIFKTIKRPLTRADFVKVLEDLNIRLEDDVFDLTFLKMDTTLDGEVTWDDVISFLLIELLENQEVGEPQEDMLKLPISSPPEVFEALHRHPILRMTFTPEVNKDRSVNYMYGKFVTVCKEGDIRFWSSSLVHEKTVHSASALLRVRPTWVTDLVAMPDVNIIGTSSTDRELRFYDMTANKWELRVLIWGLDKPVVTMHYHFCQSSTEESCLIVGDCGGNIRALIFNPYRKGPFRQGLGDNVFSIRFADLLKGGLPGLQVVEFLNIHSDWVRQVLYHCKSNSFISCASCPKTSVFMSDVQGTKSHYRFNVPGGVTCFSVAEETHILVTGGCDCNVRVWNLFVPRKPSFTLIGHHAAIVSIVLQALGNRVYTMDMSRCIRVWNCTNQTCIQTFSKIMAPISLPFSTYYQPYARTWIIASNKITVLHCCPKLFDDRTDGFTHTKPVTVVLYNSLFRCIITAGIDSSIMVWDPWRGRRSLLIRNAHVRTVYGKQEGVEITAACFDPPQQQLLTGARNGTLKVWNFNTGNCVRNMTVGASLEVTSVMWVPQRILAVSWNKLVTEWVDSGADLYGKQWEARHTADLTCAAVKPPECLASASSSGELFFWRLETGQPYARYNVTQPVHKSGMMHYVEEPVLPPRSWVRVKLPDCVGADAVPPSIHCMQFLTTRSVSRGVGTLLVSLGTGRVQMWSHHQVGGYLTDFLAVHTLGDYVACMTVDPECKYLFTGHAAGYIKIWLMSNYCYPGGPVVNLFRPALRKEFPFLNVDRILGRAKRAVRNQPLPMLMSSLRGHKKPVSSIEYLPKNKMIVTGSADHTVRIWTLAGEYIGTLGTFRPWIILEPGVEWDTSGAPNIPADLKRNSSFTTMKVLRRGYVDWSIPLAKSDKALSAPGTGVYRELTMEELEKGTYGQRLYKPLLGRCFKLPNKALPKLPRIKLDTSLRKVEVFGHIPLSDQIVITKPDTPPLIRQGLNLRSEGVKKKSSVAASSAEDVRSGFSSAVESYREAKEDEEIIEDTTAFSPIKTVPSESTYKFATPSDTMLATSVLKTASKQTTSKQVSLAESKPSFKSVSIAELKSYSKYDSIPPEAGAQT